jgi:hypothetical protein
MLKEFANEARLFVHWANGKTEERMDAKTALHRIVALYAAALHLPSPFSDDVSNSDDHRVDSDEARLIYKRASTLPFKYYSEVFDPLQLPPEEPVIGDIADDIADIYRDVASGLNFYEHGRLDDARWEWGFNFQNHWGEHASGSIRALHCYLAQEDIDSLTSGP